MLDIYSTRAQLAAIEQMPLVYSFLFDTFVKDMGTSEDERAIYDFRKGERLLAPFVHPGQGGILMGRQGFETREIGFCNIAPERLIDSADIAGRSFGEKILGAMTPAERSKKMQARDLMDMRNAIQRRREWMAMKVLLTGKLDIFQYTHEGRDMKTSLVADYQFTNNFTPTTKWGTTGADITSDMMEMFDLVYDSGTPVDVIVMAPDVAGAMLADDKYTKLLDIHNVNIGEINMKYRGQGVRYIGMTPDGVEMYSLSGKYLDDDGQVKATMPSGTIIAGSRGILKCLHGPVTVVEGNDANAQFMTYIKKEVPQRVGNSEANAIKNRLTSRPTIIPFNVDGWVVGNVL